MHGEVGERGGEGGGGGRKLQPLATPPGQVWSRNLEHYHVLKPLNRHD